MMHPDTRLVWISEIIGFGVVATAPLPRGTITWVKDPLDIALARAQVTALPALTRPNFDRFSYAEADDTYVLCWDHGRYMNHACDPSCLGAGYDFDVAVRDLEPGDELTTDYGSLNLDEPMPCACGAADCRRVVLPEDPDRLVPAWDARVAAAFARIPEVPQVLWPLLSDPDEVLAVATHKVALRGTGSAVRPRV